MSLPAFTINPGGSRQDFIGASFAYEITRRLSQSNGLNNTRSAKAAEASRDVSVDDEQAVALAEKHNRLQELERALASTVAYMNAKHGEKAASAMMALVYKRLGNGEITEQTLGNAFLDVTRFIDKNFGISAGDDFMAHLNGNLNDSINSFFKNGQEEIFMAVSPPSTGEGGIDAANLLEQLTKEYTEAIKEMLKEARAKPEDKLDAYADPRQKEPLIGVVLDSLA